MAIRYTTKLAECPECGFFGDDEGYTSCPRCGTDEIFIDIDPEDYYCDDDDYDF